MFFTFSSVNTSPPELFDYFPVFFMKVIDAVHSQSGVAIQFKQKSPLTHISVSPS